MGSKLTYPAESSNLQKSVKEHTLTFLATNCCSGLPTEAQSLFHTQSFPPAVPQPSPSTCGTQDPSAGVCLLLLSPCCMVQGFQSYVQIINQAAVAPHGPLPSTPNRSSFHIALSQKIVQVSFNGKRSQFLVQQFALPTPTFLLCIC